MENENKRAAEVARDCINNAWMWSRVRGFTLRAVEVSEDLFAAYEAGLTGFSRPMPASALTPKPRRLPYKGAIVTPNGQPGWSLRVTQEDPAP